MDETKEQNEICLPQQTDDNPVAERAETTPQTAADNITVPVKFNKQVINLPLSDAATLAQKGMKLDAISGELSRLRKIAGSKNQSISEFLSALERQQSEDRKEELLSECGGNEELAQRILRLEGNRENDTDGFAELQEFFPTVKDICDLPESVVERAKILGSNLLDEYLRYREGEKRARREAERFAQTAVNASVGPQSNNGAAEAADAEFIKGLWGR